MTRVRIPEITTEDLALIRFALLGSGSSGNATLVITPTSKVLIDAGLSFKQLQMRAAALGEDLDGLSAVFVTHEHTDHVHGIGVLSRKLGTPIFMTEGTRTALPASVGDVSNIETFEAGDEVGINGLSVTSFSVSHDATDPVSYTIGHNGAKLGMAADLGHASQLVRSRLAHSQALVLESNYCPNMLTTGPYPPQVQQRIRGRQGHLSNSDMSELLGSLLHHALRLVVLVHVSAENNTHDLVRETAQRALGKSGVEVFVARQDQPTSLFEVRP